MVFSDLGMVLRVLLITYISCATFQAPPPFQDFSVHVSTYKLRRSLIAVYM